MRRNRKQRARRRWSAEARPRGPRVQPALGARAASAAAELRTPFSASLSPRRAPEVIAVEAAVGGGGGSGVGRGSGGGGERQQQQTDGGGCGSDGQHGDLTMRRAMRAHGHPSVVGRVVMREPRVRRGVSACSSLPVAAATDSSGRRAAARCSPRCPRRVAVGLFPLVVELRTAVPASPCSYSAPLSSPFLWQTATARRSAAAGRLINWEPQPQPLSARLGPLLADHSKRRLAGQSERGEEREITERQACNT